MLLVAICIGVIVLMALGPYLLLLVICSNWTEVITVDGRGNPIGKSKWVRNRKPDKVTKNGLSHVEAYVTRLSGSQAAYTSLIIDTPDGQGGLLLSRRDSETSIGLNVEWRDEPQKEKAIRTFFSKRHIAPTEDYLAGNGNVSDATRILTYPILGDAYTITKICQNVLQYIYYINYNYPLNFTYWEHTED